MFLLLPGDGLATQRETKGLCPMGTQRLAISYAPFRLLMGSPTGVGTPCSSPGWCGSPEHGRAPPHPAPASVDEWAARGGLGRYLLEGPCWKGPCSAATKAPRVSFSHSRAGGKAVSPNLTPNVRRRPLTVVCVSGMLSLQ